MASIDYSKRGARSAGRGAQTIARAQAARQRVRLTARKSPEPVPRGEPASPLVSRLSGLTQFAGALTSLALIGGLAFWGYRLAVRDVSGIPVVRAIEGPMRVQPDDPGGQLADYQGLAVNRIQAQGSAAPTADRVVLAPTPVDVSGADPAGIAPRPRPAAPTDIAEATPTAEEGDAVIPTQEIVTPALLDPADSIGLIAESQPVETQRTPEEIAAAARSLAEQVAANATPLEQGAPQAQPTPPEIRIIPASVPGVVRSRRPLARPAGLVKALAERPAVAVAATEKTADSETVASATTEVDPQSIPPRTSLAQLGAFESSDLARSEWQRLIARFPEYFGGKSRVIQEANSGGRHFYRLRVQGFDDLSDARRFCSALLAENAACIPVTTR